MSGQPKALRVPLRARAWRILEHPDRGAGRAVAAFLIALILLNVAALIATSIAAVQARYGGWLEAFETFSIIIFSAEYALRLWASAESGSRLRYACRPVSLIDLAAILPFYLGPLLNADLRVLRILRLLRLLKLSRYFAPIQLLGEVLRAEARTLAATVGLMAALITLSASLIHYAERTIQPDAFGDIPRAMWWAAVTLTTVGYGDVSPVTPVGQMIAVLVMVTGVVMVALPAGMLASRFSEELQSRRAQYADAVRQQRHDEEQLEELREKLRLSVADARKLRTAAGVCPACGARLGQY